MRVDYNIYCFVVLPALAITSLAQIPNPGYESGAFKGWTTDVNWTLRTDVFQGAYQGYEGRFYAWSGANGEQGAGSLRSDPFVLEQEVIRFLIAGWSHQPGSDRPRNYVLLRGADGKEIDRVLAPNSLAFTTAFLRGNGHLGETVYLEAVDDSTKEVFSMFSVDGFRFADPPPPLPKPSLPEFESETLYKVENENLRILVNKENGSILRITDKSDTLELITDPRLADSFRLCLPIPATLDDPGTQANYFMGNSQVLTRASELPGSLRLFWAAPLRNAEGALFPLSVTMSIALRNKSATFEIEVSNGSGLELQEVWYPLLGGLRGLGERLDTHVHIPWGDGDTDSSLFWNARMPYDLGTPFPEYLFPAQPGGQLHETWMSLYNEKTEQSVYYGLHDAGQRRKILRVEIQPGIGRLRRGDRWPRVEEVTTDTPVGATLGWVYYLPSSAGQTKTSFSGGPVILEFQGGDWSQGRRTYESWRMATSPQRNRSAP